MNRVNSLKDKVAELANRSVGYDKERVDGIHPIVLVDAVKSIIGLDFKRPNNELLNWLDKDVLKHHSKNDVLKQKEHKAVNASFRQLKEALLNNQKSKVDELLLNFNMLTDGTQLVEFFLEMSLYQSGLSFVNIWRSFKIFKFIKLNDSIAVSYDGNPQNRLEILNLVDSQVFTYSQTNILLLDSIRMSIKSNSKISSSFLDNIYSKLENHDL